MVGSDEGNKKPTLAEMSKEDLIAHIQKGTEREKLFQDQFKTQLDREYGNVSSWVKESIGDIAQYDGNAFEGLSDLRGLVNIEAGILAAHEKASGNDGDITSAPPSGSSGGNDTKAQAHISGSRQEKIAFMNKFRNKGAQK